MAYMPVILLFILTDISLTQNVFYDLHVSIFEIIMYFKGWLKEFLSLSLCDIHDYSEGHFSKNVDSWHMCRLTPHYMLQ